jgi:hypothetical protein
MKAFFRRCKRGETPGYPRFRSQDTLDAFHNSEHNPAEGQLYGTQRLSSSRRSC